MLFRDQTKTLIEQSIEAARNAVRSARIDEAWMNEDYLLGEQLQHMTRMHPQDPKNEKWAQMPKLTFPFCDTIIGELSKLYKKQPRRYFDSERPSAQNGGIWRPSAYDDIVERWHDLAERDEADYLPTLKMADMRTRHHGRCIVRVWPAFDRGAVPDTENYPRFDVFHPGQFDVIVDRRYPTRPLAVILFLETANSAARQNLAQVWTADTVTEVVNGIASRSWPNPLRVLPFIGLANYIDPQEYWRAGLARKIVRQNAAFDLGWTHLFSMAIAQAHGQPYAKNPTKKQADDPNFAWWKVWQVAEDGEFGFANAGANIDGMIAALDKLLERVFSSCGLPTNRFREDAGVESGAAYRAKNGMVLEDREDRAALFLPRECSLWRMAFLVGAAFGMHSLSGPPKSIQIDYAEPEIPEPTQEQLEEKQWNLERGLVSMVDEYRRINPDVASDDEALVELRRNAAVNAEFLGMKPKETLGDLVRQARGGAQKAGDDKGEGGGKGIADMMNRKGADTQDDGEGEDA